MLIIATERTNEQTLEQWWMAINQETVLFELWNAGERNELERTVKDIFGPFDL